MPTTGEVSLYFHIPFCKKKCPYCHFFVLPDREEFKEPFLKALLQEWQLRAPLLAGKEVVSIYFGGGTPTKLRPAAYAQLLHAILQHATLSPTCEITLEANPEDVTLPLMQEFYALGINRVSLGVQSLIDTELTLLGRGHGAKSSLSAIDAIHSAGITNLSIDLLLELPSQTRNTLQMTLKTLSQLPLSHLSLYNLTFEPNTMFFKRRKELLPQLPPDTEKLALLQEAIQAIEALGLLRYEISAFCRPGYASRHNVGYWTARPFLGLGPSAFSYWEGSRFSNVAAWGGYLEPLQQGILPVGFQETLLPSASIKELFVVELRLLRGARLPASLQEEVEKLKKQGWLEEHEGRIRLTEEGRLFYDSVAIELI
jgi:oxygen-independent coproporphyrinogen-3 oxidase